MSINGISGVDSFKLSAILDKIAKADVDGDGTLNSEEIATIDLSYNITEGMTVSQAQSTAQEECQREFVNPIK